MLIELYGSFLLFSGFLPVVFNFLYRVPVIGWLLTLPGINRRIRKDFFYTKCRCGCTLRRLHISPSPMKNLIDNNRRTA
nr:unnamed protein product [Spirometra erinaceieuropaei]